MKTGFIILILSCLLIAASCRKKDGIRHNRYKDKPSVVLNKENKKVEVRGDENYGKMMKQRRKNKRKTGTYGKE